MNDRTCCSTAKKKSLGMIVFSGMMVLVYLSLTVHTQVFRAPGLGSGARIQQADLDRDGRPEYYNLVDARLTVTENNRTIWQSPPDWQVTQFVIADSINDGRPHLNLVVWKRGSYGTYRPFWFEGPDDEYCNHLYVFDLVHGVMKPVWMSSKIEPPIINLQIYDADGDGQNELVVKEGSLNSSGSSVSYIPKTTIWRWDVWDFYRVDDQAP
jgi:hypothetical protein